MSEAAFLSSIAEDPEDVTRRMVFADWLEDQGDPRAKQFRASCKYRGPIRSEEVLRFAAWKVVREQATGEIVDVESSPRSSYSISPMGLTSLRQDLARLNKKAIEQNFPRTDDGQLALKKFVRLATYLPADGSRFWLNAQGPRLRTDPQRITVLPELEYVLEDVHNWTEFRNRWDSTVTADPFESFKPRMVPPADRKEWLATQASNHSSLKHRIAHGIALQDEGRFESALRLFDVDLDENLIQVLNAEFDWARHEIVGPVQAAWLRRILWEMAPWNFASAFQRVCQLRPRANPRLMRVPLTVMPGQNSPRMGWLSLCQTPEGHPRLVLLRKPMELELSECHWKRPIDWDIERLASLFPTDERAGGQQRRRKKETLP